MTKKPITILAINPGTRYLGIAVFQDADLRDWGIKTFSGKWSKRKLINMQSVITDLLIRYQPDVIALKVIHPSRSSDSLDEVICEIHEIAWRKGIDVQEYSIENIETFYSPEKSIGKRELAEMVVAEYPALFHELERELKIGPDKKKRLKKYHSRMFEAVALGSTSFDQLLQEVK